ncbi:efflux transporter outer membrane subunit [Rhodoferax sp.]|uniref:efflux transporter outer membrane subunit n=1 Tax=Rhodoferax sp. TaxID=50421 RepID=UPI0025CD7DAA|nr:efflux transporter outer membrane subunit [Rhodoferax sp.]
MLPKLIPVLGWALLLSACSTTPPYQAPKLPATANAFKETGLWHTANPQAAAVPDDWWQLFNDPVLNGLQTQVGQNQNLLASAAQIRVAQAALGSSRAALSPTLGAGLTATRSASPTSPAANSVALTGSASWELDLWGRLSGAVTGDQARVQASQDDLAAARLSLQATVAQTYFSLRAAEAQSALLERSMQAYQRSLELTQNRYQGGVASADDVAQAQTQLKTTSAQRIESDSSRAQLEHALAVLLGLAPSEFSLPRTAALPNTPEVPDQLPANLLERRPDIAAAERRVAAAYAQIGVAKAAFFPALTLSASAGYKGSGLANLVSAPNLLWSVGPALALAAFDGGLRQSNVDSARASTDAATASYRQTVLTALQEVEDNLVVAGSLQQEAALQTEALAAANRSLEIVKNQYQSGTVSYLNVVVAQATALSSERSLLDVQNRRLAATNQLLKNIAGRWNAPS